MASDWIKFRCSLLRDGRVRIVSAKCPSHVSHVVGSLVVMWCLADEQAEDDGEIFGYTSGDIDELVGIKGFCEALPKAWIDLTGEWVRLPNYQQHNGATGKRRAQDQKRKKAGRTGNKSHPQNVPKTSASNADEKRTREEKIREDIKDKEKPSNEGTKESAPPDNKSRKTTRFTKPTIQMVSDYISTKSLNVDASLFFHHYESNGWLVGPNPMKNWKSSVQVWHRKNQANNNGKGSGNGKSKPAFKSTNEQVRETLQNMYDGIPPSND